MKKEQEERNRKNKEKYAGQGIFMVNWYHGQWVCTTARCSVADDRNCIDSD